MQNQNHLETQNVSDEPNGQVMTQLDMETMIDRYLKDIQALREKIKEQTSMFKDTFSNDKEYEEQTKKIKDLTKVRNGIKDRIMQQVSVKTMSDKIKSLKEEMNDLNNALAGYVQQYQKMANTNQITLPGGEVMQIVLVPKLQKLTDK